MNTCKRLSLVWVVAIGCLLAWSGIADAKGGRGGGGGGRGGGARPSMGHVGGGGGRPSGGHAGGGQRPAARPQASRPNVSRPSMAHASRPNTSSRPNVGSRPSGGGFSPSGGRPNISRPSGGPGGSGVANRPSVRPAGNVRPTSRPSLPGGGIAAGNRPNLGDRPQLGNRPDAGDRPSPGGNRPGLGDRPSLAGVNRPTTLPGSLDRPGPGGNRPGGGDRPGIGGNRPTTLPGTLDRPGIGGNRPGGGGDRPGIGGNRPTTLPGTLDRPGIGGNRPGGGGDRPGIGGNRPGLGDGDRPGIGGNRPGIGGNRPGIGGNVNIGNDININRGGNYVGNRAGWDRGNWNSPGWGWGGGGWAGNWHNNCIRPHYGWYNGCWNGGYWGSNWYAPLAWGAVGWGLGSLTSGWGYGTAYYNPYYSVPVAAATVPYDYSQPVVVNNYVSSDASADTEGAPAAAPAVAETTESQQATQLFDEGLARFKTGDYRGALAKFDAALQKLPGDPVVHEVRAVTLFALGEYKPAAAALNSLLSSAPGMDWTTMSSLYGSTEDYQAQLRKLEQYCKANPTDASAYFVLAYQYLVIDSKDAAISALKAVVKNQPKDSTAKRMLDALAPAQPATPSPTPLANVAGADAPDTDLVGSWRAKAGDTTIDLAITEDSQFTWKAMQAGKPTAELKGQLASTSDELVLQSPDQGAMAGSVKSLGPDRWQFALSGAPSSDPGLSFARIK